MSSDESLFIKTDSLEDSLNALFSQHKIETSLKLLLICSCDNRSSDIGDDSHETLFPVKEEKLICSTDSIFRWRAVLPEEIALQLLHENL